MGAKEVGLGIFIVVLLGSATILTFGISSSVDEEAILIQNFEDP